MLIEFNPYLPSWVSLLAVVILVFAVSLTPELFLLPDYQNPLSFRVWSSPTHAPTSCPKTNQTASVGNPMWLFKGACAIFNGQVTPFLPNAFVNPHFQPLTIYTYGIEMIVLDLNDSHYKVLLISTIQPTRDLVLGNNKTEWFARNQPINPILTWLPLASTDKRNATLAFGKGIPVGVYTYNYALGVKSEVLVSYETDFPIEFYFSDTPGMADEVQVFLVLTNTSLPLQ